MSLTHILFVSYTIISFCVASVQINANYVSFASPSDPLNAVCCQGPTPETTPDMWRLIAEQNIEIIVMLTNLVEGGRNKCAQYWPAVEGSTEIYGTVQVLWAGTETAVSGTSPEHMGGVLCLRCT